MQINHSANAMHTARVAATRVCWRRQTVTAEMPNLRVMAGDPYCRLPLEPEPA